MYTKNCLKCFLILTIPMIPFGRAVVLERHTVALCNFTWKYIPLVQWANVHRIAVYIVNILKLFG